MRRTPMISAAAAALLLTACGGGSDGGTPTGAAGPASSVLSSPAASSTSPAASPSSSSSSPSSSSSSRTATPPARSTPAGSTTRPAGTTPRRSSTPAPVASGTVVVLNPGHDGGNAAHPGEIGRQVPAGYGERKACDTTGTNTDAGYPEHAFTWDLAKRVRTLLRAHGITVVMTRSSDTGVGPCVDERAAIGNRADVAASVSLHADGAPASGHGFHVNQASRRPDGATARVARQSVQLGQALHRTLEAESGLVPSTYIGQDGYYYRDDLAGLNLATRPTSFLELGNMRNGGDAALLSSASGRQRIARAVADGILAYLGR